MNNRTVLSSDYPEGNINCYLSEPNTHVTITPVAIRRAVGIWDLLKVDSNSSVQAQNVNCRSVRRRLAITERHLQTFRIVRWKKGVLVTAETLSSPIQRRNRFFISGSSARYRNETTRVSGHGQPNFPETGIKYISFP